MTKKRKKEKLDVHPELPNFDIHINSFGQIVRSHDIDQINAFLNKNLKDKKIDKLPNDEQTPDDTNEI